MGQPGSGSDAMGGADKGGYEWDGYKDKGEYDKANGGAGDLLYNNINSNPYSLRQSMA